MATFTSDLVSSGQVLSTPVDGSMICRKATYEISAALVAADLVQMIPVYKGEIVHDVILKTDDLDTNGTPAIVLDVGDGVSTNWAIDGSTVGQAGGVDKTDATAVPKAYTADDTLDVDVDVAPATGATTGTIELWAYISGKQ